MPTHPYSHNVAQALSQIKDEDEIWGEITAELSRQLKELLEGILEYERDQVVACPCHTSQCQTIFGGGSGLPTHWTDSSSRSGVGLIP